MAVDAEILRQKKLILDMLKELCAPESPPELPDDLEKSWFLLFEREIKSNACLRSMGSTFLDHAEVLKAIAMNEVMEKDGYFKLNTSLWFKNFNKFLIENGAILKSSSLLEGKEISAHGSKENKLELDEELIDTLINTINQTGELGVTNIDLKDLKITAGVDKIKELIIAANKKGVSLSIHESFNDKNVPEWLLEHGDEIAEFVSDPENNISINVKIHHNTIWPNDLKECYEPEEVPDEINRKVKSLEEAISRIDSSFGERFRKENIKKLKKAESFKLVEPSEDGEVRKGKVSLDDAGASDVELTQSQEQEQEQEAEEEQEMMSEREAELDSFKRTGDSSEDLEEFRGEVFSFAELQDDRFAAEVPFIGTLGKTGISATYDLAIEDINSSADTPTIAEYILGKIRKGSKVHLEHSIHGISKGALDAMKYYLGHFSGGFDEDNLPHGFEIKVQEGKRVIDFNPDAELVLLEDNYLQVKLEEDKIFSPVRQNLDFFGDFSEVSDDIRERLEQFTKGMTDDWLESVFRIMEVQDKSTFDLMVFKSEGKYYPVPEYKELFDELAKDDVLDDFGNSAVCQVKKILYKYGATGVKVYMDRLSSIRSSLGDDWLNYFINPISKKQNDVDFLIGPDADEILAAFSGMSKKETDWLLQLLKKEQEVTKFANTKDLIVSYKKFISELKDLGVEVNSDMPVPETGNTKLALSKILYIIKDTPSPNRKEQMAHITSDMDISSTGAWYAKKHDGYYLVTKEMGLNGLETSFGSSYKSSYSSSEDINKTPRALLGTLNDINYYRFIGQQLQTAKFECYKEIKTAMEESFKAEDLSFGSDGSYTLLGLLAIGTTGRAGKYCANVEAVTNFAKKMADLCGEQNNTPSFKKTAGALLKALADSNSDPEISKTLTIDQIPGLMNYALDLRASGSKPNEIQETISEGIAQYGKSYIDAVQSVYKSFEFDSTEVSNKERAEYIVALVDNVTIVDIPSDIAKKQILSVISHSKARDIYPVSETEGFIKELKKVYDSSPDNLKVIASVYSDMNLDLCTELPSRETLNNIITVCTRDDDFSESRVQALIQESHPGVKFLSPPAASTKPRVSLEEVLKEQVEKLGAAGSFTESEYKDIKLFSKKCAEFLEDIPDMFRPTALSQISSRVSSHFTDVFEKDRQDAIERLREQFSDPENEGKDKKLKSIHLRVQTVLNKFSEPKSSKDEKPIDLGLTGGAAKNAQKIYSGLKHGEEILAESQKFGMISGILNRLKNKSVNELSILMATMLGDKIDIGSLGAFRVYQILDAAMDIADASPSAKFPNKLIKTVLEHPNITEIAQTSRFDSLIDIIKSEFNPKIKDQLLEVALLAKGNTGMELSDWKELSSQVPDMVLLQLIGMQKDLISKGESPSGFNEIISSLCHDYNRDSGLRDVIESILMKYGQREGGVNKFIDINRALSLLHPGEVYSLLEILESKEFSDDELSRFAFSCREVNKEILASRIKKFKQVDLHVMPVTMVELEQYVKGELELKDLVKKYTHGALSVRKKEAKDNNHFDETQISRVIDELGDLNTDPVQPLSLAARKSIATDMMYINSIGEKDNLPEIEGVSAKAVIDMTDAEIRKYIAHCKGVATSPEASDEDKKYAKLNFLALTRESLCRSTRSDEFAGVFAYTSQIISVLNSMHQGSMHISEIDTGQGKSHIAALHAAMKWLEGDTVDICTSSMALAKEGLDEHKKLFDAIGIKTSLVSAGSDPGEYMVGGINYSTVSEMSLFKARAKIENTLSLDGQSSLILDEADFTTLDDTIQYKYAGSTDGKPLGKVSPHAWVYKSINNFIDRPEFKDARFKRKDDVANLRSYIEMSASEEQKRIFKTFSDVQLDKWIDAALSAKALQGYGDYKRPDLGDKKADFKVEVVDGAAHARILVHGLPSKDAKWSDGVHQFLHDRLNSSGQCEFDFPIPPEANHLASTNAKDLVQSYGTVWGMTGTIGDTAERAEQAAVYGFKMTKIAPHQACRRVDHDPKIEFGADSHKTAINNAISSRMRTNDGMPTVVVCKDMDKSAEMFEDMLARYLSDDRKSIKKNRKLMPLKIQIFDGAKSEIVSLDYKQGKIVESGREIVPDATAAKKNAGEAKTITLTTAIMGRGTDFKPKSSKGGPHPFGLLVIQSFVDSVRSSGQIVGRGGRNGQPGESLTIVDGVEMATEMGVDLDTLSVESDSSVDSLDSLSSQVSVDSIDSILSKRSRATRGQRQERQAFGNIQNTAFSSLIQILAQVDNLTEIINKKYDDKLKEINKQIKSAGDDEDRVAELNREKRDIQAELSAVTSSIPKRKDILKDWAILLKEFGEASKPHKIREALGEREIPKDEHAGLEVKVEVLSDVMITKWNSLADGISSRINLDDVETVHVKGVKEKLDNLKSEVSKTLLTREEFSRQMKSYVDGLKGSSVRDKVVVPPPTSASVYCHRAVAKVEMTKPSDYTSAMLEEGYKEQMIATLQDLRSNNKYKSHHKLLTIKNPNKLSGGEVLEVYNSILERLADKAKRAKKSEDLELIVDLKKQLDVPHRWLTNRIRKRPELMSANDDFIKSSVQIRQYEKLAREMRGIKKNIDDLAKSIKPGSAITFEHVKQLSDMLDSLDKASKTMRLYDRQLHRFSNEKHALSAQRLLRGVSGKFDLDTKMRLGEIYGIEDKRERLIETLRAHGAEPATIFKVEQVHSKMNNVGNRIRLAFHRLGNWIASWGKSPQRNTIIEPESSLEEKIANCKRELGLGHESDLMATVPSKSIVYAKESHRVASVPAAKGSSFIASGPGERNVSTKAPDTDVRGISGTSPAKPSSSAPAITRKGVGRTRD
jgi:hypothetical protein